MLNTKTFAVLDLNFAILSLGVELHCRFLKKKKKKKELDNEQERNLLSLLRGVTA